MLEFKISNGSLTCCSSVQSVSKSLTIECENYDLTLKYTTYPNHDLIWKFGVYDGLGMIYEHRNEIVIVLPENTEAIKIPIPEVLDK